MPGFAVIDFETTGLFAGGSHRVIEVAVAHVSADGQIEGQWETLINPGRDLGRQDIHRVRAADVMNAPTFAEVAPQLVALLDGRVIVAHNAAFDIRFLLAELARAGYPITEPVISLCTMQLARDFLPGTGRSLADCCAVGVNRQQWSARAASDVHTALLPLPSWQTSSRWSYGDLDKLDQRDCWAA